MSDERDSCQYCGERFFVANLGSHEAECRRLQLIELRARPQEERDDEGVQNFAEAMKRKMARARSKGRHGWDDPDVVTDIDLASMLLEHLARGNAGTFEDVANFAMMLHQRGADPSVLQRALLRLFGAR